MRVSIVAAAALAASCAVAAEHLPPAFGALLECRAVAGDAARLACYDAAARELDSKTATREVIVIDQAEVAETKRRLFGFPLPHIALFDRGSEKNERKARPDRIAREEVDRLEATVKSASRASGHWIVVLEDGARWEQIDAGRDADDIRAGMPIVIKRASLGSYFAHVGKFVNIRIRRIG